MARTTSRITTTAPNAPSGFCCAKLIMFSQNVRLGRIPTPVGSVGASTPVVCCAMSLFLMPLRGLIAGDELHYSYRMRGSSQA